MKTRSIRKFIIPSFALLIGGSLVATISSTLAWFQYATSARVAYVDALSHCSKLLKISVDGGANWGNDFYQNDMAPYLEGNHLVPITTGPQAKNTAITGFYSQPDFGRGGNYDHWLSANNSSYARFTIKVKVNDVDGASTPLVNDVYITDLIIQDDLTNGTTHDLSNAVRVHLAVTDASEEPETKYFLFAKGRGLTPAEDISTTVGSYLDLNNDGAYDKDFDNFGTYAVGEVIEDENGNYYQCIRTVDTPRKDIDTNGEEAHWKSITPTAFSNEIHYDLNDVVIYNNSLYRCNEENGMGPCEFVPQSWTLSNPIPFYCMYGDKDEMQVSYSNQNSDIIVKDPDNPEPGSNPISIGKTGATAMNIVVTTWIEGWTELENGLPGNAHQSQYATKDENTSVWDPGSYINKKFNVGIRLGVKSHDTDHQN